LTAGARLGLALLHVAVIIIWMRKKRPDHWLVLIASRLGLPAAFGVTLISVIGSLYFSQFLLYEPCNVCWWQRVCMFPLILLLGIAWWKQDGGAKKYILPLSSIGAVFAAYNSYIQIWPPSSQHCALGGLVDCSSRYIFTLGFITIPFVSLIAFLLIFLFMVLWRPELNGKNT
jgi:disulfide bond formation protein DsbB